MSIDDKIDWSDFLDDPEAAVDDAAWSVCLVHIDDELKIRKISAKPGDNCFILAETKFAHNSGSVRIIISDDERWYPIPKHSTLLSREEIRWAAHVLRTDVLLDIQLTKGDLAQIRQSVKKHLLGL